MLIFAAAPLGNPRDATLRLCDALKSVPYVAAEDSRRFKRLCDDLAIAPVAQVISFFEGNEQERLGQLMEILSTGDDLLVITDAGMPGISDPGFRLARAAVAAGIEIDVLPGASASTTALLHSGLAMDRFSFEGFLPRTSAARQKALGELASQARTMIFFEAPHRLPEALADFAKVLGGDRQGVVCRELTKRYQEVVRASLAELVTWSNSKEILGEITLVIAGQEQQEVLDAAAMVAQVALRESAGLTRKEAISDVAQSFGLPKREVFDAVAGAKQADRMGK
jgi:16S rRNA (cytidine1402-2'-O)-methyltransferase